jgi:hypothetical protein
MTRARLRWLGPVECWQQKRYVEASGQAAQSNVVIDEWMWLPLLFESLPD